MKQKHDVALTIGHNVGDVPTWETCQICEYVSQYLDVDAFTAFECVGMWRGMPETSTRIEICATERAQAIAARVPYLAQALKQDAIMCQITPTTAQFIEQANEQIKTA